MFILVKALYKCLHMLYYRDFLTLERGFITNPDVRAVSIKQ